MSKVEPKKKQTKSFRKLSIYRKTFFGMIFTILFILLVLAVIYSFFNSRARIEQLEIQLLSSAQASAERVETRMDAQYINLISAEEKDYLAFTAKSTESIIWLINSEGGIIYYSSLPNRSRESLKRTADNFEYTYYLEPEMLNTGSISSHGKSVVGDFYEVLPDSVEWLSVSYPLNSDYGYSGEILLHYSLGENAYSFIRNEKSLWISFIIAFIVAVIVIILLSNNITRPISKIVKVAEEVYHGNLETRVILKDEEPMYIHESSEYQEDDLMILVRTMNTMISKWEKQENERNDFMSSISHDLRTPLTSIKGFLGAIEDGTIPYEKRDHYLSIVYQEVERLQNLIENLFNTFTIDQQQELKQGVFDIEILMQEVISSLDPMINKKSIHINLDSRLSDNEVSVLGDRDAIHRVIYNILSNAVKFTPESGFIRVEIILKGEEQISISIEDNGAGISKEDRQHIFNRFYKVNKSRNTDGSGMGLYIARSILSLHGQSISVGDSSLGGVRFTFTLARPKGRKI